MKEFSGGALAGVNSSTPPHKTPPPRELSELTLDAPVVVFFPWKLLGFKVEAAGVASVRGGGGLRVDVQEHHNSLHRRVRSRRRREHLSHRGPAERYQKKMLRSLLYPSVRAGTDTTRNCCWVLSWDRHGELWTWN